MHNRTDSGPRARHDGSMTPTALVDPPVSAPPTCLLCHTPASGITVESLATGSTWKCERCGQLWDADRLERAAGYAEYVAAHPGL